MILDGYNRRAIITDGTSQIKVIYRPLLSANAGDWKRFKYEVEFLDDRAAQRAIDDWLMKQIVQWELPHDSRYLSEMRRSSSDAYEQLTRIIHGVEPDASGERWRDLESKWAQNLYDGVLLALTDPKLAGRSCDHCQKFWYLDNGTVAIRNSTGEMEERPRDALPSCRTEFGCAKGTPENQKSLNVANGWAWRHFQGCDAIGQFPDDEIVKHNAKICRRAVKRHLMVNLPEGRKAKV